MMANNITFTHSPFWVQIWGLPFDIMTEKIRKEIDNNLGIFMAADARSWNFKNNLLLLKRWERGMMANNITFTHSPFWVQIWGLPSDIMIEKIRKEIDNNLGIFMAVNARSWMLDQEKFMRIRVNLPPEKPLRRCGKVASLEGEIFRI